MVRYARGTSSISTISTLSGRPPRRPPRPGLLPGLGERASRPARRGGRRGRPPRSPRRSPPRSRSRRRSGPGPDHLAGPGQVLGHEGAPPPTATSGRSPREVFTRSIASASIASARSRPARSGAVRLGRRAADLGPPGRDARVRQRRRRAAEDERLVRHPVADALGPERALGITLPPPSAIVTRSGIRKFVRIPPISTPTTTRAGSRERARRRPSRSRRRRPRSRRAVP